MSNQYYNLCNHRSFFFCSSFLKPYATTPRPFFPFHRNLILSCERSRSRSSSLHLTLAALSSSDIILISTTEHHDGSLVFRFGDASEVVENADVVEEMESQTEKESSVAKVLDGDQDTQVVIKTAGRGYNSVEGGLIEIAGGIRNVDIDSGIAECEPNAIRDLRDNHAESSDRLSDISEKEVHMSQSDAKMSDYFTAVESTLDEAKFSVQLDEEESSDPTINLLDNIQNIEKSADLEGTPLKGSVEKIVDLSVFVELEIKQVSQIEDDLNNVEIEGTRKRDTPSAFPATMHISDIKLADAAVENVEEELKEMIIDEGTLIDEHPPSVSSEAHLLGAVNEDLEEDLNDMDINEVIIIDEMSSSDQLVVEPTLDEVNQLQSVHVKDQTMEDELQQVSTKNMEENDLVYVMPVSCIDEAERTVEDEVSQPQYTTPLELKPTIQVQNIDLRDTMGQNLDDGILEVDSEIKDPSVSVKFKTIQVSDNEVMDVTQPYTKDESHMAESKDISEGYTTDLLSPAIMHASDVDMGEATFIDEMPTSESLGAEPTLDVSIAKGMDSDMDERLQDMNVSEATFIDEMPTSALLEAEPASEGSTTEDMDVKDLAVENALQVMSNDNMDENEIADAMSAEPNLEEEVSQPLLTPVELKATKQVSDIKVQDVTGQNLDDEILQVIDDNSAEPNLEEEISQPLLPPVDLKATTQVSDIKVQDVTGQNLDDEILQVIDDDSAEPNLEEEVSQPLLTPVELKATVQVSDIKVQDVTGQDLDDEILQVIDDDSAEPNMEEEVSQTLLTPVELKATMQVSDIKVQDVTGQNLDDEILQVIYDDSDDSCTEDVEQSSHQLESQPVQNEGVKHNMLEQYAKSEAVESSILLKQGPHVPLLEAESTEAVVGTTELAEASEISALPIAAEAEVEREEIYLTDDFLLSGAALLEHPFKALTGGDDAYFVAGSKWLGVANGVSQWSFEGTYPGVYAQELMKTCEEIVLDTSSVAVSNPVELLCRGVKETNMSGSANVLIANFNGQVLHIANIGDTGFLIIRHGAIYKKSTPLLHEFHFALQVEDSDDPLPLVEEHVIELEMGDIVVSATDGLFDNLYEREIIMIVFKSLQAGMKPQEIANILATRAQEVGKSAFVRSPFSDAAQAAGYTGYAGGKPDNVVVIVSLVEKRSNLLAV